MKSRISNIPGITLYLAGGLGNQIFMAAAGLEIANKLNLELFVNSSFYEGQSLRRIEILETKIPFNLLSEKSAWTTKRRGSRAIPFPRSINVLKSPPFIEFYSKNAIRDFHRIRSSRTLFGYFQSFDYFPNIRRKLPQLLLNSRASNYAEEKILKLKNKKFIAVHIRRGDLINKATEESLSWDFIKSSIEKIYNDALFDSIYIFTDSPNIISAEIKYRLTRKINIKIFDSSRLTSLETLICMSQAKSFILGASTFSFWSAWLCVQNSALPIQIVAPISTKKFWDRLNSNLDLTLF